MSEVGRWFTHGPRFPIRVCMFCFWVSPVVLFAHGGRCEPMDGANGIAVAGQDGTTPHAEPNALVVVHDRVWIQLVGNKFVGFKKRHDSPRSSHNKIIIFITPDKCHWHHAQKNGTLSHHAYRRTRHSPGNSHVLVANGRTGWLSVGILLFEKSTVSPSPG